MTQSSAFCSRMLLQHCRTSLHTSSEDEESPNPVGTGETSSHPHETSWIDLWSSQTNKRGRQGREEEGEGEEKGGHRGGRSSDSN